VAITSVVMKYFERLIKDYICAFLCASMDPMQFACRPNRSADDAVSQVIHSSLSHLDSRKGGYVRMLFIDLISAFNTTVPTRLAGKLVEHQQVESILAGGITAWFGNSFSQDRRAL